MACETRRLAAFCVPGRKAAGRAVRVPSRGSRKQQKKEEVLRFHKTSSLVRWKGLSRALADSPQDCPPRPGRKAAGRAVRVPSRGSRKQQKKEEVLRFHKTSSLVRWKGLSRALADSPQDCPPRPGRKAAGRAVRVPSRGSRKQQKKKRFCVSTKPLLWCSGTFAIRTFVLFFTVERQFSLSLIHTSKMPHRSASSVYIDQNHNCYVLCTASPQE